MERVKSIRRTEEVKALLKANPPSILKPKGGARGLMPMHVKAALGIGDAEWLDIRVSVDYALEVFKHLF